jgi:hypothetical protein
MSEDNGKFGPLSGTIERTAAGGPTRWHKVLRFALSPWLILCFPVIGWGPLFIMDGLRSIYPHPGGNYDYWAGWDSVLLFPVRWRR